MYPRLWISISIITVNYNPSIPFSIKGDPKYCGSSRGNNNKSAYLGAVKLDLENIEHNGRIRRHNVMSTRQCTKMHFGEISSDDKHIFTL